MSQDSTSRRILPQNPQNAQMSSFSFAPQQFPQRETQKNYVFVDEHNRHKRLKVMRACEGCRRRKIKCDAATTNTWPCSACIRLKLTCVRPNGYDGAPDSTYDPPMGQHDPYQQMQMQHSIMQTGQKPGPPVYASPQSAYPDANHAAYQNLPYDPPQAHQHNMNYGSVPQPISVMDSQYATQGVFPTPPLQAPPRQQPQQQQEPSPEAFTPESYGQQDLGDLLGSLKLDEKGTAPYLRNKASFRREEEPAVEEEDEFEVNLPPVKSGHGSKIRIPPELMPEESDALNYIDAFFTQVHPYVPVLNKATFYHQWHTNRGSISPLILEAIFALGGRLRDDPSDGHQWLALASRHADAFMDIPRLSTLQGLLLLLKAREAAPKRGYFYRSWMTIVQCVQMGIDLGLDEHFEDHQMGRGCDSNPIECQLRTRIWQTVFVCEVMVGAPQGRRDLAVPFDSVDFALPRPVPGGDDSEYHLSRNFTYITRVVRNVRNMTDVYMRIRKKKEWAIDPEMTQLTQGFDAFFAELPADLTLSFPQDGSAPWLPTVFIGNLHSYYHLTVILYHRPQLSALDPTTQPVQWKHHMMICYDSAKALCRLQEALLNTAGLEGLQCMQRGFSFTVYAGLSCILLHLVAVVSPDPDLNTDARQFFTRHMRIMEKVMDVWPMPEVRAQVEAVREAFSADTKRSFVLKPSFPYGSPHPSDASSPASRPRGYRPAALDRAGSMDQHLDTQNAQTVSYLGLPISPPISTGTTDSNGDSPGQPLIMMPQGGQAPGLQQGMPLADQPPSWNPARIFEQWNASFGTPPTTDTSTVTQTRILNLSSPGVAEAPNLQDYPNSNSQLGSSPSQGISPQTYAAPTVPNFPTPAMWQESVASVYEGGLKRAWDYDGGPAMKRR